MQHTWFAYENWGKRILEEVKVTLMFWSDSKFTASELFDVSGSELRKVVRAKRAIRDILPSASCKLIEELCVAYGMRSEAVTPPDPAALIVSDGEKRRSVFIPAHLGGAKAQVQLGRRIAEKGGHVISPVEIVFLNWRDEEDIDATVSALCSNEDGLRYLTLAEYISEHFGDQEGERFVRAARIAERNIRALIGFTTVPIPTDEQYERFVRSRERRFAKDIGPSLDILLKERGCSVEMARILKRNAIDRGRFKALFGQDDFAESFIASEWRFSLLESCHGIDQTGTVAGYVKAVEQLLWKVAELWERSESRKPGYRIDVFEDGKHVPYRLDARNKEGLRRRATFGNLVHSIKWQNDGIFEGGLMSPRGDKSFSEWISQLCFDFLDEVRNPVFHKLNIATLEEVRSVRKSSLLILYLKEQEAALLSKPRPDVLAELARQTVHSELDGFLSKCTPNACQRPFIAFYLQHGLAEGVWLFSILAGPCPSCSITHEKQCHCEAILDLDRPESDEWNIRFFKKAIEEYLRDSPHGASLANSGGVLRIGSPSRLLIGLSELADDAVG